MKKYGFTLFETLLTLAIVGIVSALTLPTLINNHQQKIFVTSLHKFYNDLEHAVETYMAEQHVDSLAESDLASNADGLREFVYNNFQIQKNCGTRYYIDEQNSCFARYYTDISSGNIFDLTRHQCNIVFRMTNGMAVCLDSVAMEDINPGADDSINSSFNNAEGWGLIAEVDVNGPEGPNIVGRDLIQGIAVTTAGRIMPRGTNPGSDGYYFNQILQNNWKMNY